MKNESGMNYMADGLAVVFSVVQPDMLFKYISFGLTIIATLFSLAFTILQLIKWWKDAKKDGKITKEELDDAETIIKDGIEHIKSKKEGGEK